MNFCRKGEYFYICLFRVRMTSFGDYSHPVMTSIAKFAGAPVILISVKFNVFLTYKMLMCKVLVQL